jgi:hypothetical protein
MQKRQVRSQLIHGWNDTRGLLRISPVIQVEHIQLLAEVNSGAVGWSFCFLLGLLIFKKGNAEEAGPQSVNPRVE